MADAMTAAAKPALQEEGCGGCRFWRQLLDDPYHGSCRRRSPLLNWLREEMRANWPITHHSDWCGDWEYALNESVSRRSEGWQLEPDLNPAPGSGPDHFARTRQAAAEHKRQHHDDWVAGKLRTTVVTVTPPLHPWFWRMVFATGLGGILLGIGIATLME
jgi:hypothetical protein